MKLDKYEARGYRKRKLAQDLKGEGLYIFRNNTSGDLMLPKPDASGLRTVAKGAEFQGDSYFMQMVKNNQCRLVKELVSPQQEKEMNMSMQEKLILDQPEMVTSEGAVEHVCCGGKKVQQLNEVPQNPQARNADVLINEDPLDGVDILSE
jgi:hypothetical protein